MGRPKKILVVGAGPSGLAAAHLFQRAGAVVTVYEAREWVGGRTRTDRVNGYAIDTGAQLYASMYTRTASLLEELGARDLLVRSPGRDALWRDGRAREVAFGSVASMVTSGALGLRLKVKLGAFYLPFLARHASALDIHRPELAAEAGMDGESIEAWGGREMGEEFLESLVYPQLATFYGALPEETSAGFYHQLAHYGTDVRLFAMRGGAGTLCELLAARVLAGGGVVRLGTPVASVSRPRAGGAAVAVAGAGWGEEGDGLVLAVPAPLARQLLGGGGGELGSWLGEVRFRPALTVALLLDGPVGEDFFGLSFARGAERVLEALCIQENKGPDLVPSGKGLLIGFVRPQSVASLLDADGPAVLAALRPDLDRAFPGLAARIERVRIHRWREGIPVFYPGYLERLATFRDGAPEGDGAVALAGDYLVSPTIEGAVSAGLDAAERLLARLGAEPPSSV